MNLHEYQAKQLLREFSIDTPRGIVVEDPSHAELAATGYLGGESWVVKAQIHAGGRGKAGGVRLVKSLEALREAASALLGTHLVTYQNAA
jgi:succinyl-CoA synthetase (ADP-forming) beta subunit (EC 6.2.1.5)